MVCASKSGDSTPHRVNETGDLTPPKQVTPQPCRVRRRYVPCAQRLLRALRHVCCVVHVKICLCMHSGACASCAACALIVRGFLVILWKKRKRGSFFFLEIRQPDEFRFVQVLNNFKGLIFPKFNYSIV